MLNPEVVAWYDAKTDWLLDKYGPGPRIHFHTGLADDDVSGDSTAVRTRIVRAQERMLERCATEWRADTTLNGDVVDVGCGLGGTALWLAERTGARVTAITPVARHVAVARRMIALAGLDERVTAEVGDAHTLAGDARFDAAYAIGASNYFDRPAWFRRLAGLLRRPGYVFVEDTFLVDAAVEAPFNAYWLSRIGRASEYTAAAEAAGFAPLSRCDVSEGAAAFYRLSVAHSRALLVERTHSPAERAHRERSIAWQSEFAAAYASGRVEDLLLGFRIG